MIVKGPYIGVKGHTEAKGSMQVKRPMKEKGPTED